MPRQIQNLGRPTCLTEITITILKVSDRGHKESCDSTWLIVELRGLVCGGQKSRHRNIYVRLTSDTEKFKSMVFNSLV